MTAQIPQLPLIHATAHSVLEVEEQNGAILRLLEAERQRIAADLHDGIGQTLSALQLAAGALRRRLEDHLTDVEGAIFDYLTERIADAMDDVRRICIDHHPPQLDEQGLIDAISGLCRELCQDVTHLDVSLTVRANESDIPLPVKVAVFRILQEACSNACKHARAAHLSVVLEADAEGIRLTVADDGIGFTGGPVRESQPGFGLGGMRQRATMTGGSLSVRSQPGQGTQIVAAWQVEEVVDNTGIAPSAV